ncbi:hypothetical protein EVAR_94579_1 [Eumeta japonica]|uniref:(+)RNA virus helicase C-terminal domain-containing protein n=1 Tax=Eumeta variegata TaxID=151549 RepID=A0A4C1UTF0_EUMVA|nr:hypothetical protein EVAR_94579_1 [Eumeta japonica]
MESQAAENNMGREALRIGWDAVITTIQEAVRDLKEKLASGLGADASNKVRTTASVFVNDFRGPKNRDRPIVDKALMSYFAAGDAACGFKRGHCGWRDSDTNIPKGLPNTLYLTYTQVERESLVTQGFGKHEGTRVLTIHETQGLTSEGTVIVRVAAKHKLHDSVPHVLVAIGRHTVSCMHYTADGKDAIGRFMKRAVAASEIKDNNSKMAIRNSDDHECRRRKLETVNRRCGLLTPPFAKNRHVLRKERKTPKEIFEDMVSVLQESAPSYTMVKNGLAYFNKDERAVKMILAQGVL